MSLQHALLAALIEQPGSGLDLANRFDSSIGYFWHASHQQIYRELARMEEAGWIESQAVVEARGRKRSYRVLPDGRKELRRWARSGEDAAPPPPRHALVVRLWAEAVVGSTQVDRQIEGPLKVMRERLALYRELEAQYLSDDPAPARGDVIRHLMLTGGIMELQTQIAWVEQILAVLAKLDPN